MEKEKNVYLKEFYTLAQVSEDLDINIQTLRMYVKEGYLNAYKVGHTYYTTRDDIRAFFEKFKAND